MQKLYIALIVKLKHYNENQNEKNERKQNENLLFRHWIISHFNQINNEDEKFFFVFYSFVDLHLRSSCIYLLKIIL